MHRHRREPRDRARPRRGCSRRGGRVLLVARDEPWARPRRPAPATATLAVDVTAPDAGERIVEACARASARSTSLVNNAGTLARARSTSSTTTDWQAQWELHVMAPMRLMRAAAPRDGGARGGAHRQRRLVRRASGPRSTNPAYSVTKAAQLSLSRVFADRTRARACWSTRSPPAPWRARCGPARAGWPTRWPSARGARARRRSRRPRRADPARPDRRRRRDRRGHRLPVLGARVQRRPARPGRSTAAPCP